MCIHVSINSFIFFGLLLCICFFVSLFFCFYLLDSGLVSQSVSYVFRCLFNDLLIYAFMYLCCCFAYIYLRISDLCMHLCMCAFIDWFMNRFVHSCINAFSHPFNHSLIDLCVIHLIMYVVMIYVLLHYLFVYFIHVCFY